MLICTWFIVLSFFWNNNVSFSDIPTGSWQLYHVTLAVTNKFRVVFGGVRGTGTSLGGLSIDDINLSETQCPHHIWHIRNFTQFIGSPNGTLYSPPFYSPKGYAFQIYLTLNHSTNAGIYFHLISGANDDQLQWPCPWQQATMTLLDQNPDIRQRMSNQRSVTTDPFMTTGSWLIFFIANAWSLLSEGRMIWEWDCIENLEPQILGTEDI